MDAPCASFASLGQLMDSIEQKDIRPGTHTHIYFNLPDVQYLWNKLLAALHFLWKLILEGAPKQRTPFNALMLEIYNYCKKPRKKTPRSFTSAKGGA